MHEGVILALVFSGYILLASVGLLLDRKCDRDCLPMASVRQDVGCYVCYNKGGR